MLKRYSPWRTFVLGIVCGFILMSLLKFSSLIFDFEKSFNNNIRYVDESVYSNSTEASSVSPSSLDQRLADEYKGQEVARQLADRVRVLCWVATDPSNHIVKAVHVRDSWGKRCNTLLFMSTQADSSLPAVVLDVEEGREHLFDKTRAAMEYVYRNYGESIDWVLKTDDDTFVVVENLRYLLSQYDPSEPLYLGCRFKPFTKNGFMSGGAGYVLSRKALKLFVEEAMPNEAICMQSGTGEGEDVQMGRCLENVNVSAVDTRDDVGKGRFFPYYPEFHLFPDYVSPAYEWYWKYQYYPDAEGLDCCSDTAISFHYVSPEQLQVLDYLVFSLKVHGTTLYNRQIDPIIIRV